MGFGVLSFATLGIGFALFKLDGFGNGSFRRKLLGIASKNEGELRLASLDCQGFLSRGELFETDATCNSALRLQFWLLSA